MNFFGCRRTFRKRNPFNGESFCWSSLSSLHTESSGANFYLMTHRTLNDTLMASAPSPPGWRQQQGAIMRPPVRTSVERPRGVLHIYLYRRKKISQKHSSETNCGLSNIINNLLIEELSYYKSSSCWLSPPLCARVDIRKWGETTTIRIQKWTDLKF